MSDVSLYQMMTVDPIRRLVGWPGFSSADQKVGGVVVGTLAGFLVRQRHVVEHHIVQVQLQLLTPNPR